MEASSPESRCAHTGLPVVRQRSAEDCLLCAFAMFSGRSYDQVAAAARITFPDYDPAGPMTHSLMRRIAHDWGFALLSSIYMDWRHPGIVGVLSLTQENCGHALFWDGERLIDPGGSGLYDRAHVDGHALEFTQRASALADLIQLERNYHPAAPVLTLAEFF